VKVLCVTLDKPEADLSLWLTPHKEYLLLAILAQPDRNVLFRILSDDGRTPILADASLFAAPIQAVPDTWAGAVREGGVVEVGPRRWLELGFWERFFDGDPDAVRVFREEVESLGGSV
jgi:hypothetical protein